MEKILINNFVKTLSSNNQVQKLLIETIGSILLKQKDIEIYVEKNNNKIIHIRDWITSIVENNEEWKQPRVLTLDALNNTANKYFYKKYNKIQIIELNETHEKLIADLNDYYVVQMLTPQALDNESKIMQHCIGDGGYDQNLKNEEYQYLSLRDKFNKQHITLEIKNKKILQLQGKQNNIPEFKYLEKLIPWLMDNEYKNIPWEYVGRYYENGKWFDFDKIELKENIDYSIIHLDNSCQIIDLFNKKSFLYFDTISDKDVKNTYIFSDKKHVYKMLKKENITEKEEIKIIKYLTDNNFNNTFSYFENYILNKNDNKIYSVFNIPDNCEIDRGLYLNIYKTLIKLPNNLTVNGNLSLNNRNNTLPNGLTVNGNLSLRFSKITKIPKDIKIGKSLFLEDSQIEELPDNLTINGDLELSKTKIKKLPNNLTINNNLYLSNTDITELPDNLVVNDGLDLQDTNITHIPDNIKCKNIFINDGFILNLLNENMDIENIYIREENGYMYSHTKEVFFKIYAKNI